MSIEFYYASGSPYAWRAWFGLEHKHLAYDLRMMSFSAGDLKKPGYLMLNPRAKVPALNDDGYVLYESAAILEYLDDAYPASGYRLFPGDARQRGVTRRLVREADEYLAHAMEGLGDEILFKPAGQWDAQAISRARAAFVGEIVHLQGALRGDFFSGEPGAADFTIYPMLALALRMQTKRPDLDIRSALGPTLDAWMKRLEALPVYEKTYPPHWRAG